MKGRPGWDDAPPVKFPDSATPFPWALGSRALPCASTLHSPAPWSFHDPLSVLLVAAASAYLRYYPIQLCIDDTAVSDDRSLLRSVLRHTSSCTQQHRLPRSRRCQTPRAHRPWLQQHSPSRSRNTPGPRIHARPGAGIKIALPIVLLCPSAQTLSNGGDPSNPDSSEQARTKERKT